MSTQINDTDDDSGILEVVVESPYGLAFFTLTCKAEVGKEVNCVPILHRTIVGCREVIARSIKSTAHEPRKSPSSVFTESFSDYSFSVLGDERIFTLTTVVAFYDWVGDHKEVEIKLRSVIAPDLYHYVSQAILGQSSFFGRRLGPVAVIEYRRSLCKWLPPRNLFDFRSPQVSMSMNQRRARALMRIGVLSKIAEFPYRGGFFIYRDPNKEGVTKPNSEGLVSLVPVSRSILFAD